MEEEVVSPTEETEASSIEKIKKNAAAAKNLFKKTKTNLPVTALLLFLLSLLGGVLGSFAYLDYRPANGTTLNQTISNVTVKENSEIIDVVKKANPAVVSITGVTQTLNFFGGTSQSTSSGTGFIVQADGLIVTNKHVVSDTSTKYTVYTDDGKSYDAAIKAIDPVFDIAILKIDATGLSTVELGSSDSLEPGQTAIAIGNALGQYQNSVTVGVISAVGRVIQASDSTGTSTESLDNVIQTDAAINSGNSGGPLLNIGGQVIGVNTAVDSSGQSIGFALPVNLVKSALDTYLAQGKIVRPMLGVRYLSLTKEIATANNLSVSEGALIYSGTNSSAIVSGSPAEKAGLRSGDIIIKIGDEKITANNSLVSLITKHSVGESVKIVYLRDGKEVTTTAVLAESK